MQSADIPASEPGFCGFKSRPAHFMHRCWNGRQAGFRGRCPFGACGFKSRSVHFFARVMQWKTYQAKNLGFAGPTPAPRILFHAAFASVVQPVQAVCVGIVYCIARRSCPAGRSRSGSGHFQTHYFRCSSPFSVEHIRDIQCFIFSRILRNFHCAAGKQDVLAIPAGEDFRFRFLGNGKGEKQRKQERKGAKQGSAGKTSFGVCGYL